jgi:DNA-binding PadR family transcriptional regulator
MHGYQLRAEFEASTGGVWPLNVGQVYTTLARLERDHLVVTEPEADGRDDGRVVYRLTEAGRSELEGWFAQPVERQARPRDELAIKLAMALGTPGVDVRQVVQAQRKATLRTLRELTRLKAQADPDRDAAWLLVHELGILRADAEARWLDHCDARLADRPATARTALSAESRSEAAR